MIPVEKSHKIRNIVACDLCSWHTPHRRPCAFEHFLTLFRVLALRCYITCCYAADGVGWGGVGRHVNVPCTSYIQYCHAAEISGIVYYVTCCYAADGVGWGGVGGHVNVPLHLRHEVVATSWMGWGLGGVGWGMLTFPCTCVMKLLLRYGWGGGWACSCLQMDIYIYI